MAKPTKDVVHYAKDSEFIRVGDGSIWFEWSHDGIAFCNGISKQPITDAPINCQRCVKKLVKWAASTAAAKRIGVDIDKARAICGLSPRKSPAPAGAPRG